MTEKSVQNEVCHSEKHSDPDVFIGENKTEESHCLSLLVMQRDPLTPLRLLTETLVQVSSVPLRMTVYDIHVEWNNRYG